MGRRPIRLGQVLLSPGGRLSPSRPTGLEVAWGSVPNGLASGQQGPPQGRGAGHGQQGR
jgi:hypothetical protein